MPLRNATPLTVRPATVTDSIDGTNSAPGSMMALADLVPSMHTRGVWVPRPASMQVINFSPIESLWDQAVWDASAWDAVIVFSTGELLQEIGDRVYGFATSSRFPGYSEPFCYDFSTSSFVDIVGIGPENIPQSAPATGDWTPPTLVQVGAYTLFSHPGFSLPNAFGWLDTTSFSDTATGDTGYNAEPDEWDVAMWDAAVWSDASPNGGTFVANLSKNALLDGWRPGQLISDRFGAFPAGTRIVSISTDGKVIELSQTSLGPPIVGDVLSVHGGTPQFPLWAAGNTNLEPLPEVATAISLFNGRAAYAVKNAVNMSDAGDPLNRASEHQPITLTIQNGLNITAMATQPFNNATVIGGVVQALLLFQGKTGIWQVTGDPVTSNLALNFLSALGCDAPLSLATSPEGLLYIAPDGLRMIQLDGTVSPPLAANGDGEALPFINAVYPSRICAAYNEDVYRASATYYQSVSGAATSAVISNEFWYHLKLKAWSGPHSFPASLICASNREATAHGFLLFALQQGTAGGAIAQAFGAGGIVVTPGGAIQLTSGQAGAQGIWFSNTRPMIDSTYVENGKPMNWIYRTTLLPDTGAMFENFIVESAIAMALPATLPFNLTPPGESALWDLSAWDETEWDLFFGSRPALWDVARWDNDIWDGALSAGVSTPVPALATVQALDEAGNLLVDEVVLAGVSKAGESIPPIWDVGVWDQSSWDLGPGGALFAQRAINWPDKLVFKQTSIVVRGPSAGAVALGNLYLRYQRAGYMIQDIAA